MAISNENVRVMITIPINLKEQLELEAKDENRSLSNYIVTIIQRHHDNKEKSSR
ncbi:ribbon-helix-helix domain-containing protein [Cohnella soli]|uniref:CopG-like ribbon-helix-helix domain-containing protein n=1 Tax=Cohnella soli TaxID=425005 RepID=A0ABW0HR10_9BACL